MKKIIPIFFTIDDGYAKFLSIAMASLIENANPQYQYNIHIVYESLSDDSKNKLKTLENDYAKVIFNEMKNGLHEITHRKENMLRADIFTLTIYYRIFIPFMFPEYDKGIYIDSDTVILGDISELYNIDLKDNFFGGCNDISCQDNEILCNYFKEHAGASVDKYINSGLLLMNMKKLREVNFESYFLYLLNKYHFDTVCPDQDYINAIAYGKILHIPNVWDAMPTGKHLLLDNPKIVHYNLFYKPWRYDNIDYEEYFWRYAQKSLFKDEIIKEKESFTEEDAKQDEKDFAMLVARADQIAKSNLRFKKIYEEGLEKRIDG